MPSRRRLVQLAALGLGAPNGLSRFLLLPGAPGTSGLGPIGSKLVKDIIVRLGQTYKKTIQAFDEAAARVNNDMAKV